MPVVTSSSPAPTTEAARPAGPGGTGRASLIGTLALGLATGVALWASQEPLGWGPLAFAALVPLLLAADDARRGTLAGTVAGVTYFGLLLSWVMTFGWFAWVPLVAALALELVAFGWLAGRMRSAGWALWRQVLVLPSALVVLEWARDRWPLGGFTWGEVGASQAAIPFTRTVAAIGGVALLTWLVVASNVALADAVTGVRARGARGAVQPAAVVAAIAVAFTVSWLLRPAATPVGHIAVGIVQANTFEGRRVAPDEMIAAHLEATRALPAGLDLIVWGESSLLTADPTEALGAKILAASSGVPVIANASVVDPVDPTFENTTVLFTDAGIADRYVKRHLVPFGEWVPMRKYLSFIGSLSQVPRDAQPGSEAVIFDVDGAQLGTLTCFETVFPDPARELVDLGAEGLVFTTNNASFRRTAEADQYIALTRLRATETHRAVSLATVSGKSATIDPSGDVLQTSELFTRAALTWDMPLQADRTLFARLGHWAVWSSMVVLAAAAVLYARAKLGRVKRGKVQ